MGGRGSGSGFRAGGNSQQSATVAQHSGIVPNAIEIARYNRQFEADIQSHTTAQNDRAERILESYLAKEEQVAQNYDTYVATGYISGESDPWWQDHQRSLGALSVQLDAFRRIRARLGR